MQKDAWQKANGFLSAAVVLLGHVHGIHVRTESAHKYDTGDLKNSIISSLKHRIIVLTLCTEVEVQIYV